MPAMSRQQLRSRLDELPRVRIAATPTPLQEAENLSRELGVRILVKRDDLTGLVMGGNKVRHMDFCMADALEKGADVSINVNASTNASRIIGAASKKVGMDYICVAPGSKGGPIQGNLLIQDLFGADLHLLDTTDAKEVSGYVEDIENRLRNEGRTSYNHVKEHMSRSSAAISYMDATLEIAGQLDAIGVEELKIYIASGGGQGGLQIGAAVLGLPWDVLGILIGTPEEAFADVVGWSNNALNHMGFDERLAWEDVVQIGDYIGPGYARVSPACIEAIRMAAELEGLLLDPVHTGKVMAGIIDHARSGVLRQGQTVLFIHTGGLPDLFDFAEELRRPTDPATRDSF
jgi:1-aminocyclopropane-1-carboxylate deaminase/D-cysteine desulfhydrase-like pyridoxal-dependent ACC family enzyme